MSTAAYERLPKPDGSTTLGSEFYEILEEAIVAGLLEPGERILVDELAAHFGTSRIPVREALRALDANGWVEIRPRLGAYVTRRTQAELSDLFELRLLLEPQVSRLAAERRTEAQLDELDALVAEGDEAATDEDAGRFSLVNKRFHVLVARCAQNALLERAVTQTVKRASFYLSAVSQYRVDVSAADHRELVEAIRFRDGDGAAERTVQHIRATEFDLREILDKR